MSDMNGKVALITGASSGIGRATAEAFAARGGHVVLAARRKEEMEELAREIRAGGGKATFEVTDVAIAGDVERMVGHAIESFGRLDYAVNNAGIEGKFAPISELREEEFDRVMDVNLKGTFLCLQHEARAMLAAGRGGEIVNVGSVNSFLGYPTGSAYVTSKHALIGLTSSVSAELAPRGIRQSRLPRLHRYAHASPRPRHIRRRLIRQSTHSARPSKTRRPTRRNRANDCLPMLRRSQLHLRHHANPRRRLHADHLSRATLRLQSPIGVSSLFRVLWWIVRGPSDAAVAFRTSGSAAQTGPDR